MAYVPLPGSKRQLLPDSRPAGAVDPSEVADLTIRVRSKGDLKALEQQVYKDAQRPLSERSYLSHDKLEDEYGAAKEDLDKLEQFARRYDLIVVHRSGEERSLVLRGTRAFLTRSAPPCTTLSATRR